MKKTFPVSAVFQSSVPHHGSPGSPTDRLQSGLPMVQLFAIVPAIPRILKFQMFRLFVLLSFLDWSSTTLIFVILGKVYEYASTKQEGLQEVSLCFVYLVTIPAGYGTRAPSPPTLTHGAPGEPP